MINPNDEKSLLDLQAKLKLQENPLLKYCPWSPHPKQAEFLRAKEREVLYGGAAAGGKTVALLMCALQYVHLPQYRCIIFRRSFSDLELANSLMDLSHEWLDDSDASFNPRWMKWTFPSGATIQFAYIRKPRDVYRYQSASFHCVIYDELTHFELREFTYLFSRMRKGKKDPIPLRMRAATNPGNIGHRWVKERFIDHVDTGRRRFIRASLYDNPHLDHNTYAEDLKELSALEVKQLLEGEWVDSSDERVFEGFSGKNLIAHLPEGDYIHILGVDLGYIDATAFTILAYSEEYKERPTDSEEVKQAKREIGQSAFVIYSRKETKKDLTWVAQEISSLMKQYDLAAIVVDTGAAKQGVEDMRRRYNLPLIAADKKMKRGYLRNMNADFEHLRLFVLESEKALVREIEGARWADASARDIHKACEDHCIDSLCYAYKESRHFRAELKEEKLYEDDIQQAYEEGLEEEWELRKEYGEDYDIFSDMMT